MNCRRVQRRISLFLDDRLSSGECADVAAHLLSCDSCRSSCEEIRGALAALSVLERAEPADDGWQRLLPLLEQPHGARRTARGTPKPVWAGLAAAAVLAVIAGSALLLRPVPVDHTASAPAPPAATATKVPEAALRPAPRTMAEPQTADARPVTAGSQGEVNPTRPVQSKGRLRAPAAVDSRPRTIASAVRSQATAPAPVRSLAGLEPDPEFVAYAPPASEDSVAEEVADMVSTGLAPLVAAAETEDPLSWITDASAEEWL